MMVRTTAVNAAVAGLLLIVNTTHSFVFVGPKSRCDRLATCSLSTKGDDHSPSLSSDDGDIVKQDGGAAAPKEEDDAKEFDVWTPPTRPKRRAPRGVEGSSWMDRNNQFMNQVEDSLGVVQPPRDAGTSATNSDSNAPAGIDSRGKHVPSARLLQFREERRQQRAGITTTAIDSNKTFRQDFRGTRVFVQNIPNHVSWQDLKDHFRVAGDVVFASVSVDQETGESKGHGIVQFETTEMAKKAIKVMRDHPLDNVQLYVREDAQEKDGAALKNVMPGGKQGPTPPTKWRCADEDVLETMSQEDYKAIRSFIKARDEARKQKNYEASDGMREKLKTQHGVHIDDRLKMWWVSVDGRNVPAAISDAKGDGRWGNQEAWRQIPTTLENDACVNPDQVSGLLRQRDIARKEKDFSTADALLEEARCCPDGDLNLRIHDESRTWRIWTDTVPPPALVRPRRRRDDDARFDSDSGQVDVSQECVSLLQEHAPEKVNEVRKMLEQFPGREGNILQKLKQRYLK